MQHPKVAVIGAGSLYFGRQAIWQMVNSPHLRKGTLGLVDTDAERLEKMASLARKAVDHAAAPLAVEASVDRRDVLNGCDFIVLSFARETVKYRGIDCEVAERHGVRMCSGDTIGPGGVFRTLRELPEILAVCADIEHQCPHAWVINYINPTAANGIGLRKYAPRLKSFALCDSLHMPHVKRNYARRAGIIESDRQFTDDVDRRFDFRIAGPNHFTWLLKAEFDGRDVTWQIAEAIRRDAATETDGGDTGAKAKLNNTIGWALYDVFGRVPTCVGHTKEYVRFWQGLGRTEDPAGPLSIWQTAPRYERHAAMWRQVDAFNSGEKSMDEFMDTFGPDHATDIIESMWGELGKPFFLNVANAGAVSNLPEDAFLELLCDVDMDGPRPRSVGAAPVGLRGLWQQVLDTHELSADAAVSCDRAVLRRAMLCDPIVNTIADADAIIDDLLAAERDALPDRWYA
ncbi:MAG: glycoside hydrolase family 4 [Planctomycetota bacterium]